MHSNETEIEAGDWLARLDRDSPSAEDLAAFEQWQALDARHGAAFARLAATWQALDRIRAVRPSIDEPINNDYLVSAWQQESLSQNSPVPSFHRQSRPRVPQRVRVSIAAAASLLICLVGAWAALTLHRAPSYSTGIGGFQRIVLADQSAIELNTNSEVRVALSPNLRRVELVRGEASFEVAHDVNRPFVVLAGGTAVRAVGTRFDVRRLDNSVEVIVDEGRVAVGTRALLDVRANPVPGVPQVSAGEAAFVSGSGVELKALRKTEITHKLAWQNQMLAFDGDTLVEIVAQFNRFNERQIVIVDPALATLKIGGFFRPTNLDVFISVLQSDFGIRVNADGNRLELTTRKKN